MSQLNPRSIWGRGLQLAAVVVLAGATVAFEPGAKSAEVDASLQLEADACVSAEDCYAAAVWPKERLGNALTKDQVVALKLKRLRRVMERHPASIWGKRAGLLMGVSLIEPNPGAALTYLRAAQRDFPVLEDYTRFWIGSALLHLGDAKEAAVMFESVLPAVPDTNLASLVTLRAAEAWYQASNCPESLKWLSNAVNLNDNEPQVSQAWLRLASCQLRDGQLADGRETLTKLWTKFPHRKEAKEAESLLASNLGGEFWSPQPEEYYARAHAFLTQALHREAIEELTKFLSKAPMSPLRNEVKLKVGVAQVRLKLYDQARETFEALAKEQAAQSDEATVWLGRVYLRQGRGPQLLELANTLSHPTLSQEQKAKLHLFTGIWLEDEARFDDARQQYQQMAKLGDSAIQRADAWWREGWVLYRTGRYPDAIAVWQHIIDQKGDEFEPQALYWIARSYGHLGDTKSQELFLLLCQQYPYTYYCQLAREQAEIPAAGLFEPNASVVEARSSTDDAAQEPSQEANRAEIEQQPAYRRARELRSLGLEQEAARELTALTDRFSRAPDLLADLSIMLNEVGAYHHALRLARARFRDQLERTGGAVAADLWRAAYPTGLLPTIKMQAANSVDPLFVAAIIREESQYDERAVSRVGAIGLMQVMPATANAVARRHRLPSVERDDLFDQETNILIGTRYIEQLLQEFSGNLVQAAAAYNAGPIAVENWVAANRGRSEDEFVELIQYRETRQYVKRVLRSYKEYRRLTGQPKSLS